MRHLNICCKCKALHVTEHQSLSMYQVIQPLKHFHFLSLSLYFLKKVVYSLFYAFQSSYIIVNVPRPTQGFRSIFWRAKKWPKSRSSKISFFTIIWCFLHANVCVNGYNIAYSTNALYWCHLPPNIEGHWAADSSSCLASLVARR